MNAKGRPGRRLVALLLAAGFLPGLAQALEPLASLVAAFQDPLQTVPELIGKGPTLPGDGGPPPCPVVKDFAMPLTLAEAADLALCNNAQIKIAWSTIKIQAAALGEARAA